ncbi:ATPase, T2SS/T4P/T4SS family [Undibacterium arcticum]
MIEAGFVTKAQLEICLRQQRAYLESGRAYFIEQILVMNRFCSKAQISSVIDQDSAGGQSSLFQLFLPVQICKRYLVFPLRVNNGVMEIKSARPLTPKQIEVIRASSYVPAAEVKVIPTDLAEITSILSGVLNTEHTFEAMLDRMKLSEINGVMLRQAIHSMLVDAVNMRASDIHIDKQPDPKAWISHRIDGRIIQSHLIPARIMAAIFTKIKTEAGMDASDDRRSQDGRVSIEKSWQANRLSCSDSAGRGRRNHDIARARSRIPARAGCLVSQSTRYDGDVPQKLPRSTANAEGW